MSGGGTSILQGGAIYAYGNGGTVTITISDTEFKSNTVGNYVSICIRFVLKRKKPRDISCMSGGGTSNLQGGAIYVWGNGGTDVTLITISNTEFKSHIAQDNVSEILSIC